MLTCLPQGICSWKFTIPEAGNAEVELFSFSRKGLIRLEGVEYAVVVSGLLTKTWTLTRGQEIVATASGLFSSAISLQSGNQAWLLVPQGIIRCTFEIRHRSDTIGVISSKHAFTRRATIECSTTMPVLQQLFAFWIAAEKWRAQADSSSAGAIAG